MVEYKGFNIPETVEECFAPIKCGAVAIPTVILERNDGTKLNTAFPLEKVESLDDIPGSMKAVIDEIEASEEV